MQELPSRPLKQCKTLCLRKSDMEQEKPYDRLERILGAFS